MADTKLNEHLVGKVWTRDRAQRGSGSIYTSSTLETVPGRGGMETLAASNGRSRIGAGRTGNDSFARRCDV